MKAWSYLSEWTSYALPKNIQKRLYKFVLRRAIGQFLQNELDLENFDIALMNGNLELRDLDLNLQFINKLLDDTPFVLEKGSVASISASIPWAKLLTADISLKIQGLQLCLRPVKNKPRAHKGKISNSFHGSPTTSAAAASNDDMDMEGLQVLTKVIDKMMSRVKIDIIDTLIRITHQSAVPLTHAPDNEYHLDICIPRISYFDETPEFNASPSSTTTGSTHSDLMESSILMPPVANETIKIITFASPEIWLRSAAITTTATAATSNTTSASLYSIPTNSETTINQDPYEALLFTTLDKKNWIRMKLRPSIDGVSFLSVKQIDCWVTHMRAIVSPQQIAFFMDLLDTMTPSPDEQEEPDMTPKKPSIPKPLSSSSKASEMNLLDDLDAFNHTNPVIPPPAAAMPPNIPERKIKLQISLVELFLLGNDDPVSQWSDPGHDKNHIRFAIQQLNLRLQQFPAAAAALLSILEMRIANVILDEWIVRPPQAKHAPFASSRSQTTYNVYNPIFQFDNRIKQDYRAEEQFPAYMPLSANEFSRSAPQQSEAIRVRIEKKQSRESGGGRPSVFDDLQSQENIQKRKVRVKCAFIRILLFAPDMSQISTREEFNDRFHDSQLSIDIKALVATWNSTTTVIDDALDSEDPHPYHRPTASKNSSSSNNTNIHTNQSNSNKLNIDLSYVNVFMQLKNDDLARCWFTAKTMQESSKILTTDGTVSPSIEITIQEAQPVSAAGAAGAAGNRSGFFGSGANIVETLFQFLEKNENFNSEQKVHMPMDEQAESAMIFKQRTIETSTFVVNCHLPQADMNLTKQVWDKVQIIQNDLLLWQPRFITLQQQQQAQSLDDMSSSHSMDYHNFFSDIKSTSSQSLFSIVAVMSNGVWDICTSETHTYRLQFSEFKYFAAIKHLGENENVTTLDIEDLDVTDISDVTKPVKLLYKTIPKKIHLKRNTSMVSLISKLNSFPDSNRINKVTSVVACNLCWKATADVSFVDQIVEFQKVPEEMVFIDPPTQYIKVFAHILETCFDYEPIYSPTRAVVIWDGIEIITNILAGQPLIEIKTFIQSVELYLMDDKQELDMAAEKRMEGKTSDARNYWTTLGFANAVSIQNIELAVKIKLDEHVAAPQTDVSLVSTDICIDANADSFQTLLNLITFQHTKSSQDHHTRARPRRGSSRAASKVHATIQQEDMLASIDETAFKATPQKISPPTMIEAPDMEEFSLVEEFYQTSDDPETQSTYKKSILVPPTKPRRKQHRHKRSATTEDIIRILTPMEDMDERLQFEVIEDYFSVEKKAAAPKSVVDITKANLSLRVTNVNVIWKLYDGYEWAYVKTDMAARDSAAAAKTETEEQNHYHQQQQTGFGEDFIKKPTKSKRKRAGDAHIEFRLDNLAIEFDMMPEKDETAFWFHLRIKDVEIIDNIRTSAWKKFLGYMRSGVDEREVDDCMVNVELISLRPVKDDPQQEYRLKARLLPIRLYVDQDAMTFLQKYFLFEKSYLRSTHAANLSIPVKYADDSSSSKHVDIYPITLKVDYKPKVFNLGNFREGQVIELMNLFRLDAAEMQLSHIKLTGIKGMDGLLDKLGKEWLPHILNTQKGNMVSGVSPVRSIVNLSTGVADLVLLPIQQYRKDGRLMKGIQRGTSSFARATAIEAIKLSSRVATGTQVILEHADGFFSPTTPTPPATSASYSSTHLQQLHDQHQHFVYTDVHGAELSAMDDDLSSIRGGTSNAKAVIRAVPVAVIKPMIGLTGAFQSILTGLRNSIDPVMRLQSEDVSCLVYSSSSDGILTTPCFHV
ncbi:hypothetical protein FB192DRAFT_1292335 [Mucor lusitanicus]|uniref:Autophagy-related protein 2 n=1 Tax=Mucor circinelloides f. lusitanicus TaxID=29924 RepID=A0A8H4B685_MUCCL|nr:hypothetical protein FB192DRAFT_1292335 [Mucor lusitanicus]